MGIEALTRAAEAAGYAMASIEDVDDVVPAKPVGEAVARGAREPKADSTQRSVALVPAAQVEGPKSMAANIVDQSVAAGNAIRHAVYGYIAGRGAPA